MDEPCLEILGTRFGAHNFSRNELRSDGNTPQTQRGERTAGFWVKRQKKTGQIRLGIKTKCICTGLKLLEIGDIYISNLKNEELRSVVNWESFLRQNQPFNLTGQLQQAFRHWLRTEKANVSMQIILHPWQLTCPQKGTILVGNTSSKHWFSGDMLVFRGVNILNLNDFWALLGTLPLLIHHFVLIRSMGRTVYSPTWMAVLYGKCR